MGDNQNESKGMSIPAFAKYIKEQTGKSWEEVCYLLLKIDSGDIQIKEQLATQDKEPPVPKPLRTLIHIAMELGWGFMLDKQGDHEDLNGMIIGNPDYLDRVAQKMKDN